MTAIIFGISADFPGQTPGQSWDANWTLLPEQIAWDDVLSSGAQVTGGWGDDTLRVPVDDLPNDPAHDTMMAVSYGINLQAQIFLVNIVAVDSYLSTPGSGPSFTEQDITMTWVWNSMKDIEITSVSPQTLTVTGFVDTWINAAADNNDHTISINDVKRGEVALGDGNDTLSINVASNEYTWSNAFNVSIGNGNDTVSVQPEAYSVLANLSAPAGWTFNTAPQLTNADITVGNGNDTVALFEVSGTIHVGSGTDTIHVVDGNSTLWLGTGSDTVTISARNLTVPAPWAYDTQVGSSTVNAGSGHADITIDDTTPALTPRTTLNFIHGETGGSTLATADAVHVGHVDTASGSFVAGDLTALVIDLAGYSAGSAATLTTAPAGDPMLLQIHDAATGGIDAVALYGNVLTSAASLSLHFT